MEGCYPLSVPINILSTPTVFDFPACTSHSLTKVTVWDNSLSSQSGPKSLPHLPWAAPQDQTHRCHTRHPQECLLLPSNNLLHWSSSTSCHRSWHMAILGANLAQLLLKMKILVQHNQAPKSIQWQSGDVGLDPQVLKYFLTEFSQEAGQQTGQIRWS